MKSETTEINQLSSDEGIARAVVSLLDANDNLEKALISAAREAPARFKSVVRECGERIYLYLDKLNGRLERYSDAGNVSEGGRQLLFKTTVEGECQVSRLSGPIRLNSALGNLRNELNGWSEVYLEMAAQLERFQMVAPER